MFTVNNAKNMFNGVSFMNLFTVSFFGHRVIERPTEIERKLDKLLRELILEKEYVEFLVGRNGEFDQLVSSSIIRCQRDVFDANSAHVLVLPYLTADYRKNIEGYDDYYDEIEVCEVSAGAHYKAAFQKRNRSMVDRSSLVVFFVDHNSGGAFQTMNYAKKSGKTIINLADDADEL